MLKHDSIMSLEETHRLLLDFIDQSSEPLLIEPGLDPIPLKRDSYEVVLDGARLTIQAWTREHNLVRRITGCGERIQGRLTLSVEMFGKRTGEIQVIDAARPQARASKVRAGRISFREAFERMLRRQFPGWRIAELTTEPDLQHSLSPAYPRAFLKQGNTGWAAIGAAESCGDVNGALSFGLIWLSYLRRREVRTLITGLAVFMPEGQERTTCLRIRCLHTGRADVKVFTYAKGFERAIDIADAGNVDTKLAVRAGCINIPEWVQQLEAALPGVQRVEAAPGNITWRVNGLPFLFFDGRKVHFGLETRHPATASNSGEIEHLARELLCARSVKAAGGKLFSRAPETWLESQVRQYINAVDAGLNCAPVYGQVPSFAAAERGVLDLLACAHDGLLAVVEVKVTEDLHLPLQALDYWMRVDWHARRGEFSAFGYFPGIALKQQHPKLFLIAPSLCFHPTTETLLEYFRPEIEVDCVGVAMGWRSELKVVFRRSRGATI